MKKKRKKGIHEIINDKYQEKQKISYEEYVVLLSTNDEILFCYRDKMYQITHPTDDVTIMYTLECEDITSLVEKSKEYSDIIDLLLNYQIEGKRIIQIWPDVYF